MFLLVPLLLHAQGGVIKGRIFNEKNNEPVPFANIVVLGTTIGSTSDFDGNFIFSGLKPGYVELKISAIGFEAYVSPQLLVTNSKEVNIDIAMREMTVKLDEVIVKANPFVRKQESPVSLRRIGLAEIEKNPGGNRDISIVIQSFPGVASTPSFRNEVIIRGGGSNENRFYLDGVEVPNINHFSTQGASAGPVGIINTDFIREVNLYAGAFPANKGNAISSILDFRQKDGNKEKLAIQGALGATDLSLTLDGPIGDKTTFISSYRRSYLQFLFDVIGLPFLPTYDDFQFKTKTKFDQKNELTLIGLGAIDQFELNTSLENPTENQSYILSFVPVNEQWSYTAGAVFKHFAEKGYHTFVLSRNQLHNELYKYRDNIEIDSLKNFDINSDEVETKFRYEHDLTTDNNWKINYGVNAEYAQYLNTTYSKIFINQQVSEINYSTDLGFVKWGVFGQFSKSFLSDQLELSFGIRSDANSYSKDMSNMLEQISPRISARFKLDEKWSINGNTGIYYQLPSYTTLGHSDNSGNLLNKENGIKYIQSNHYVLGFEYLPNDDSKLTIEGFFKGYSRYPFSIKDSVAISGKSTDVGVFGDEEVLSIGEGRAYGLELFYRNRDLYGFNTTVSYTLVRSEFKDFEGEYYPNSWDNKHLFTLTVLRKLPKNWDFGFKWRFVGGAPYTPYDLGTTSLISAWNAQGRAYLDYDQFNSLRLRSYHQLDIRVDKSWFFDKFTLVAYADIQNVYNFKADSPDTIIPEEDENGNRIIDPNDPSRYVLNVIPSDGEGILLPSIGLILKF